MTPEFLGVDNWSIDGERTANVLAQMGQRPGLLVLQKIRAPRGADWTHNSGNTFVYVRMQGRALCCATGIRCDLTNKYEMRIGEVCQRYVYIALKRKGGDEEFSLGNIYIPPRGSNEVGDVVRTPGPPHVESWMPLSMETIKPAQSKDWITRRDWASGRT